MLEIGNKLQFKVPLYAKLAMSRERDRERSVGKTSLKSIRNDINPAADLIFSEDIQDVL